jgi:hypothetical protein
MRSKTVLKMQPRTVRRHRTAPSRSIAVLDSASERRPIGGKKETVKLSKEAQAGDVNGGMITDSMSTVVIGLFIF